MRCSRAVRRSLVFLAPILAACHDGTGPLGHASLQFSGAVGATDTVDAILAQPLVIEVRDATGGPPPTGTLLEFTTLVLSVAPLPKASYPEFQPGATNDAGKTGVRVRLGTVAGAATLVVSVPTLGLQDTLRFTVTPGNATRVVVAPAESTTYVGKTYTLRGGAADRYGNFRPDPVAWSTSSSGITISGAGVITTTATGRHPFAGVLAGTPPVAGWVNVVPPGRFAAAGPGVAGAGFEVVTVDADGSNRSALATGLIPGSGGIHPTWIPGTNTVVYSAVMSGGVQTLFAVGADAAPRAFLSTTPSTNTRQSEPAASADGNWVFFSVVDTQCPTVPFCVARARSDGTGYQLVAVLGAGQPAPSPDGSRVAVTAGGGVRVVDVATNTASTWSVSGITPAWSPDGSRIAYRNRSGQLSIVNADGSGDHVLSALVAFDPPLWSPDSRWVVLPMGVGAMLVDAATGSTVPLAYFVTAAPGSMK